jgi:Fe-S-cluster containining protein
MAVMKRLSKVNQPIYQWDFVNELVTQYLRVGHCSKCGRCCQGFLELEVVHRYHPVIPQEGGKATTGRGIWVEIVNNGKRVFFKTEKHRKLDRKCKFLAENNECESYNRRPLFCREFPLSPQNIITFPECTYTFINTGEWTFSRLRNLSPTQR